jgi:hypothetical protein
MHHEKPPRFRISKLDVAAATGWSEPVFGREVHPPKSSAFFWAHYLASYHCSMHHLRRTGFATAYAFFGLITLFVPPLLSPSSAATAAGHFEVYCDGVGIFLAKIDGAPAPRKLVLFSRVDFPPGTIGGSHIGQGKWSNVYVHRDGCVLDGKCESIADGRVWIDTTDKQDTQPKHISGKYEIKLNGKLLEGTFLARRHDRKHPLRLCL